MESVTFRMAHVLQEHTNDDGEYGLRLYGLHTSSAQCTTGLSTRAAALITAVVARVHQYADDIQLYRACQPYDTLAFVIYTEYSGRSTVINVFQSAIRQWCRHTPDVCKD